MKDNYQIKLRRLFSTRVVNAITSYSQKYNGSDVRPADLTVLDLVDVLQRSDYRASNILNLGNSGMEEIGNRLHFLELYKEEEKIVQNNTRINSKIHPSIDEVVSASKEFIEPAKRPEFRRTITKLYRQRKAL